MSYPHRETVPAHEQHIVPAYYSVSRANSTISLPTTHGKRITYHRIQSHKRPEGTVYQFQVNQATPDEERWLNVGKEDIPAEYAITFRPQQSDRQQWVAVSSFALAKEGKNTLSHLACTAL